MCVWVVLALSLYPVVWCFRFNASMEFSYTRHAQAGQGHATKTVAKWFKTVEQNRETTQLNFRSQPIQSPRAANQESQESQLSDPLLGNRLCCCPDEIRWNRYVFESCEGSNYRIESSQDQGKLVFPGPRPKVTDFRKIQKSKQLKTRFHCACAVPKHAITAHLKPQTACNTACTELRNTRAIKIWQQGLHAQALTIYWHASYTPPMKIWNIQLRMRWAYSTQRTIDEDLKCTPVHAQR